MELKLYVECVTFALCSLTVAECWYVSHDVERGSVKTISQMMVNKIDRPNTTPTVRAICKLAVYFSVFRPFSRFSLVYDEGIEGIVLLGETRAVRLCDGRFEEVKTLRILPFLKLLLVVQGKKMFFGKGNTYLRWEKGSIIFIHPGQGIKA